MKEKQVNLQHGIMITAFLLTGILAIYFLYQAFGNMSTVVGAAIGLAALIFIGWLFIDHTH